MPLCAFAFQEQEPILFFGIVIGRAVEFSNRSEKTTSGTRRTSSSWARLAILCNLCHAITDTWLHKNEEEELAKMPRKRVSTLSRVKRDMGMLTPGDLRRLDDWLHRQITALEAKREEEKKPRREIVQKIERGAWTYQLEMVRCGKAGCRCNDGQPHGPYWYGYRKESGRTVSTYIGKEFKEQ
jgi:Family of unknown function (DUF6788)